MYCTWTISNFYVQSTSTISKSLLILHLYISTHKLRPLNFHSCLNDAWMDRMKIWKCDLMNHQNPNQGRQITRTNLIDILRSPSYLFIATSTLPECLTHWGRVTHICANKLTIIGSDNGLSPGRRQAIILTNAGILLMRPLGTNFSGILIKI